MKIGKNIKKIRQVKGLNQEEFATLFSLSRATVGAYEEERALPKIDTLLKIANYFSISIDGLINDSLTVNQIHGFNKAEGLHLKEKNKELHIISHYATSKDLVNNTPEYRFTLPFKKDFSGNFISFNNDAKPNEIKIYKISTLPLISFSKDSLIVTNKNVFFIDKIEIIKNKTIQFENEVMGINEIVTFAEYFGIIKLEHSNKSPTINKAMEDRIRNLEKTMQALLNENK